MRRTSGLVAVAVITMSWATASFATENAGPCGASEGRVTGQPDDSGPGLLVKGLDVTPYRGKRLRFSATVDARGVTGWAGLLARVQAADHRVLAMDDMHLRPLRGTRPCVRAEVVVAVPDEAAFIEVGLRVAGGGTAEISDVKFEAVGDEVPLTTGVSNSHGRVSSVWFTEDLVTASQVTMGRRLSRQSPGVWSDREGDISAEVVGDHVKAKLFDSNSGNVPAVLEGELTLTHSNGVTTIEGTWGSRFASYPVRITYSKTQVDMKWGFWERHMRMIPAPQLQKGCVFYAQVASPTRFSDSMELCGGVLSATPPTIPTVMSFLLMGFRRGGFGLLGTTTPAPTVYPNIFVEPAVRPGSGM